MCLHQSLRWHGTCVRHCASPPPIEASWVIQYVLSPNQIFEPDFSMIPFETITESQITHGLLELLLFIVCGIGITVFYSFWNPLFVDVFNEFTFIHAHGSFSPSSPSFVSFTASFTHLLVPEMCWWCAGQTFVYFQLFFAHIFISVLWLLLLLPADEVNHRHVSVCVSTLCTFNYWILQATEMQHKRTAGPRSRPCHAMRLVTSNNNNEFICGGCRFFFNGQNHVDRRIHSQLSVCVCACWHACVHTRFLHSISVHFKLFNVNDKINRLCFWLWLLLLWPVRGACVRFLDDAYANLSQWSSQQLFYGAMHLHKKKLFFDYEKTSRDIQRNAVEK